MIITVHADLETRSRAKLRGKDAVGSWEYSLDPTTEVWCLAYRVEGDETIHVWEPGDPVPAIFQNPVRIVAHNYRFEFAIWTNILVPQFGFSQPKQWTCTMALAARYNLPMALDNLSARLGVTEQKDADGKKLMVKMANAKSYDPTKPKSKANKDHAENLPKLIEYCKQDVATECDVYDWFRANDMAYDEDEFEVDRAVNDRGIRVDVLSAKAINSAIKQEAKLLNESLLWLTGGQVKAATQVAKGLAWLKTQGYPGNDLSAETVAEVLRSPGGITTVGLQFLEIRKKLALGSLAKFGVISRIKDPHHRLHGLFQLYGAAQTGRWAGRMVQFQNLPRMSLSDNDIAALLDLFLRGDVDTIKMVYGDLFAVAKQLIRPMFICPEDEDVGLIVSDLSQIECRTLAKAAGCSRLLDTFTDSSRDPYSEMAAEIYHKPASEFGKGTDGRQLGKGAVLGCGYQMGATRFRETVKKKQNINVSEEQSQHIVDTFRSTFPEIPAFWRALEKAVKTLLVGSLFEFIDVGDYRFHLDKSPSQLVVTLPSGRTLHYHKMRINSAGRLTYLSAKDSWIETYGGSICENLIQATARDVMTEAMQRMESEGLPVVGHVHDELIVEGSKSQVDLVSQLMSTVSEWAKGIPIDCETAFCQRYTK
ncbi:MAG: hypothetical protein HKN47_20595 [Pirellulaceae bacterium]|nr:hypothetical protein [Pirellulaceae bacterium]